MRDTVMSYKVVSGRRPVVIVGRVVPSLVRPKCSRETQMALNIQPPPSTEHSQVVPYRTKVAVPPVEAPAPTCSVVMVSYRTGPVQLGRASCRERVCQSV